MEEDKGGEKIKKNYGVLDMYQPHVSASVMCCKPVPITGVSQFDSSGCFIV